MFSALYIEHEINDHPRVERIRSRYPDVPVIPISRYGEIFNRKNQNFRLQKNKPALILARKHQNYVLDAPEGYGLGGVRNYYFSHMLNCIYDCRYCFLQGMYQSAHYLLFVNYEDFAQEIVSTIQKNPGETSYFYSGYDCDSLALEPLTEFVSEFLPSFEQQENAILELRTKSTQVRSLLERPVQENCIIAFSFTPETISAQLENRVPPTGKRLDAMRKLQDKGWAVGLRFDPIIYDDNYLEQYSKLFQTVFTSLDISRIHSVSMGVFRLPDPYFRKMQKLFPEEKLFGAKLNKQDGMVSYGEVLEQRMLSDCENILLNYVPSSIYYRCRP